MHPTAFRRFSQQLAQTLAAEPGVIGLVLLGSAAGQSRQPDQYADHDIFVITRPGQQAAFRQRTAWLPDADRIVYHFRETAHAVKVLYDSGHLVEAAIFALDELRLARANDYRVLLDRGGVAAVMESIASGDPPPGDDRADLGQLLTHVVVGWGRLQRGEALSARRFLTSFAALDFARLVSRHLPAAAGVPLDSLDPLRRLEFAYPDVGAALNSILAGPLAEAAPALLTLAETLLAERIADFPHAAFAAARAYLRPPA